MKPQTIKKQEEKLHEKVQLCISRGKSLRKTPKIEKLLKIFANFVCCR